MNVDRYGDTSGTVAEYDMLETLGELVEDKYGFDVDARTYDDAGLLTGNVGMVLRLGGNEFQITIVQSGGERRYEGDGDDE